MLDWISDFLSERTIQVRVGNKLSEKIQLQSGTPQGSVLSSTLFLVMINDVPNTEGGLQLSMFADDCSIWKSGPDLYHNSTLVQNYLNEFQIWCDTWGFKISATKTTAVFFSNKIDPEQGICLKFHNGIIKFYSTVKFLGECNFENPVRLGARNVESGKIRPLRIRVKEKKAVDEILKEAKNLKGTEFSKCFISRDYTAKERMERKAMVEELKQRREDGDENLVIRNGRIVKKKDGTSKRE